MIANNYDAFRREFPEAAHLTDAQIAEHVDFSALVITESLRELKRKGEAILAERELQKAA